MLQGSGDIKFVSLVDDFDTGSPSSITVITEYFFAFQFWYSIQLQFNIFVQYKGITITVKKIDCS